MKPLVYSKKDVDSKQIGWHRAGTEIKYYASKKKLLTQSTLLFTLTFTIESYHDNDTMFFAHCYPYTYSDCMIMMKRVCTPLYLKDRIRRTDLCKTKAGNNVELLIITNFTSNQDSIAERKCIIISSRVHPGESNASFILEGFLEFIVSNEKEAKALRDIFVFKIIPMLNPDGVVVGNYRTNLCGLDLNR
jgi:murein tripeptide amidase MpaA